MKLLTAKESMQTCVRCGACRNVCPTLDITGREADGPRGRVLMARSLIEGNIPVNQEIKASARSLPALLSLCGCMPY